MAVDGHAVDHLAVDIQGVPADDGPLGQRIDELAFQDTVVRVVKDHRQRRFGHTPTNENAGLDLGDPEGLASGRFILAGR